MKEPKYKYSLDEILAKLFGFHLCARMDLEKIINDQKVEFSPFTVEFLKGEYSEVVDEYVIPKRLINFVNSNHEAFRYFRAEPILLEEKKLIELSSNPKRLIELRKSIDRLRLQFDEIENFALSNNKYLSSVYSYSPNYWGEGIEGGDFLSNSESPFLSRYESIYLDTFLPIWFFFNQHFPFNEEDQLEDEKSQFESSPFTFKKEFDAFSHLRKNFNLNSKVKWSYIYIVLKDVLEMNISEAKYFAYVSEHFEPVANRVQPTANNSVFISRLIRLLEAKGYATKL